MADSIRIPIGSSFDDKGFDQFDKRMDVSRRQAEGFINQLKRGIGIDFGGKIAQGLRSIPRLFTNAVRDGIEYLKLIDQSKLTLATVIKQNSEAALSMPRALEIAAVQVEKLKDLSEESSANFTELIEAYKNNAANAFAAGITDLEKQLTLVTALTEAVKVFGLTGYQSTQEIRAILTGNFGPGSQVGRGIGLTREIYDQAIAAGNYYDVLIKKSKEFVEAGQEAAKGWGGAVSNLEQQLNESKAALASGLYPILIQWAKDLKAELEDGDLQEDLMAIGTALGVIADNAAKVARTGMKHGPLIKGLLTEPGKYGPAAIGMAGNALRDRLFGGEDAAEETAKEIDKVNAALRGTEAAVDGILERMGSDTAFAAFRKEWQAFRTELNEILLIAGDLDFEEAVQARMAVLRSQLQEAVRSIGGDPGAGTTPDLMQAVQSIEISLEKRKELLPILRELVQLEADLADERKRAKEEAAEEAEELKESLDATKEKLEVEMEAQEARRRTVQEQRAAFVTELEVLRARAAGNEEVAQKLERQRDIQREAMRLQRDLLLGEKEALRLATEKVDLERQQMAARGGRVAVRPARSTTPTSAFPGLDRVAALQQPSRRVAFPGLDRLATLQGGGAAAPAVSDPLDAARGAPPNGQVEELRRLRANVLTLSRALESRDDEAAAVTKEIAEQVEGLARKVDEAVKRMNRDR